MKLLFLRSLRAYLVFLFTSMILFTTGCVDDDHDHGEKTFLGETGNWNGHDIIEIVARQPATAKFISRHLYNFFVADEPQVPAWNIVPPNNPKAIKNPQWLE